MTCKYPTAGGILPKHPGHSGPCKDHYVDLTAVRLNSNYNWYSWTRTSKERNSKRGVVGHFYLK